MERVFILPVPYALDKYFYIASEYKRKGKKAFIITQDVFGTDRVRSNKYNIPIIIVKGNPLFRFFKSCKLMFVEKPTDIDLYDYTVFTLFIAMIGRLMHVRITLFIIGNELDFRDSNIKTRTNFKNEFVKIIKTPLTWFALYISHVIIIKEAHQYTKIKSRFLKAKTLQLANCIPLASFSHSAPIRKIDFLYLNAVLPARNVDHLIDALRLVDEMHIIFSSKIVGYFSLNQEKKQLARHYQYEQMCLSRSKHANNKYLTSHAFTEDSSQYYLEARFFVFPADFVFLNYSLLEAMSYGLVPIVYNGEGAKEIIKNGINGFVVEKGVENLAEILERSLLLTEKKYIEMSENAFNTVKNQYSIEFWVKRIDSFRQKRKV